MISLEAKRHTLAHLLAAAIKERYPHTKPTIGPAIDNGFYYDFDFSSGEKPGEEDLKAITESMRKLLPSWSEVIEKEVSEQGAKEYFKDNPFKIELIDEIANKGEKITLYTTGSFTDLCRGGHAENPARDIAPDSFELDRVAGAYWRGDEKNQMLTRIYGLAFDAKEDLDAYTAQREEAKKRDHRVLAEQLDLFMISEEIGKGLPLWLPKGAFIRRQLENFIYDKETAVGYKHVVTPILTHKRLYEQSGHLAHYRDDMYSPIEIEGEEYFLRPMNCPHHHQIYRHHPISYRDLPLRIAEFGLVHRFERSGVLTGLIRARCFTQNDAHIYSTKNDLKNEMLGVLALFKEVYDTFGISDYWFRLSLPDFSNKEKYGDIEDRDMWDEASDVTRSALEEFGAKYVEGGGEAAFYGPKIDVQIRNVTGKEDTIATVQVDFYSPKRFDLSFTNEKGEKEHPVIIHRAIMGSFDRFFAFLTEQYAGAFPLWLAPVQVHVLPVSEKHNAYAKEVVDALKMASIRAEVDEMNESLGKKIRSAKTEKIPYLFIVGDAEVEARTISIDSRDHGKLEPESLNNIIEKIKNEITTKSLPPYLRISQ